MVAQHGISREIYDRRAQDKMTTRRWLARCESVCRAPLALSIAEVGLKDVNASGTLTLPDKGIVNANLAKALPLP
jgi:hypothetical protein